MTRQLSGAACLAVLLLREKSHVWDYFTYLFAGNFSEFCILMEVCSVCEPAVGWLVLNQSVFVISIPAESQEIETCAKLLGAVTGSQRCGAS